MYGSCSVKEMDIFFVHRKIKWHEKEKNDKEITKIIVVWCLFITAYTYPIIYLTPTFYYGERSFSLHGPKFFNCSQNYVTMPFSTVYKNGLTHSLWNSLIFWRKEFQYLSILTIMLCLFWIVLISEYTSVISWFNKSTLTNSSSANKNGLLWYCQSCCICYFWYIMYDLMWQIVCGVPNNLENGQENFFNINAQI